ncbi:VOC family protein [Agrococcus sp. BE272]|uniref:VOC family protein n=1 Tax=Agrococcus sp. BE272 TaxID=2817727 RepID=UPI0028552374|nr:VOC family protein [Agrococcus sp. BE272]MDR7233309.1 hypothetical protein [Agrococcus sp. BE272]
MALRWYSNVIETTDVVRLARWWADALDWDVIYETDDESVVIPKWAQELGERLTFHQFPPGLVFVRVDHEKATKNRIHMDLAPHTSDDRDAEIARLEALGARRIDVGQGPDVSWTVLADIDGDESACCRRGSSEGMRKGPRGVPGALPAEREISLRVRLRRALLDLASSGLNAAAPH